MALSGASSSGNQVLHERVASLASDNLAADVVLLDVREISDFSDYFIIATGLTGQHLDNLAERITRILRKEGTHVNRREGKGNGGWVVLDYGALVVHLLTETQRRRYNLEGLWSTARTIVRYQ